MKKLLYFAVLYQLYLVTRIGGASAESLLAARLILQGQLPYRDFGLHITPFLACFFAVLMAIPLDVWVSLVFIGFNLITAYGLYKLSRLHFEEDMSLAICAAFLLIVPLYGGNDGFPEVLMSAFGLWGIYAWQRRRRWVAWPLFVLAVATKQTGVLYPVAILIGG